MTADPRVWTRRTILDLLHSNKDAVARALWALYERDDVQLGPFLSDVAKALPHYDFNITTRQLIRVRPLLAKFWREILQEAERKGAKVDYDANSLKGVIAKPPMRPLAPSPKSELAAAPEPEPPAPVEPEAFNPIGMF